MTLHSEQPKNLSLSNLQILNFECKACTYALVSVKLVLILSAEIRANETSGKSVRALHMVGLRLVFADEISC